jgi:iron complex transport system ATP-binding protein
LILVTHHLPEIIPEITRVVLMRDGRIFRDGPKEEVLCASSLSELFRSDVHLQRNDGYFHLFW